MSSSLVSLGRIFQKEPNIKSKLCVDIENCALWILKSQSLFLWHQLKEDVIFSRMVISILLSLGQFGVEKDAEMYLDLFFTEKVNTGKIIKGNINLNNGTAYVLSKKVI